jgi:hypothetical protein
VASKLLNNVDFCWKMVNRCSEINDDDDDGMILPVVNGKIIYNKHKLCIRLRRWTSIVWACLCLSLIVFACFCLGVSRLVGAHMDLSGIV